MDASFSLSLLSTKQNNTRGCQEAPKPIYEVPTGKHPGHRQGGEELWGQTEIIWPKNKSTCPLT